MDSQVKDSSANALQHSAPEAFRFYCRALDILRQSKAPFLVGGAYAFAHYTDIVRHTKDFDVFLRAGDVPAVLKAFAAAGYRSEMVFTHWLAKVYHGEDFVDIIFASGNGICKVDEAFFEHGVPGQVLGHEVLLMPAEEMIWQKAYIMERERFDGADVAHLIRARGRQLDWDRLVARFGNNWRVILSHLVLFGFIYPDDRESIPPEVIASLVARLEEETDTQRTNLVCQGTLLSRTQYIPDTEEWGYADPRIAPEGPMTPDQAHRWTDAGR